MGMLVVENLSKSYNNHDVLANVDLTVGDGEFVTLLGPSGSGKSTLFHLIGGILMPESGAIWLNGGKVNGQRGAISYTPQTPSLMPWRTVMENVMLGSEIAGKTDKHDATDVIERAGLKGYEQAYPHELSGGMKQRVAFIRSLLSPQPLICLDEPFSALDEFTRLEMQKWLLSVWQDNKRSILFVTHNIEEALFLSDRIIILSQTPASVKEEFSIPFERPRDESILLTDEFLKWKRAIYRGLGNDV